MPQDTDNEKTRALNALEHLEGRVTELLKTCERLREENQSLRAQQQALLSEKAQLLEKNEMARSRVEAMISRLKSMEHNVG